MVREVLVGVHPRAISEGVEIRTDYFQWWLNTLLHFPGVGYSSGLDRAAVLAWLRLCYTMYPCELSMWMYDVLLFFIGRWLYVLLMCGLRVLV